MDGKKDGTYDVIIIGGGPAGLTAAIYAGRRLLKTLVISLNIGGQALLTEQIENYPGYLDKSGPKLMKIFETQARSFGAEILIGYVQKVEKTGENFKVITNVGEFEAKAIIVAAGKIPRRLNVPGEEKFLGRGISTCVTCDAPFAKNKIVAVIGGGNSAVEGVEVLSKFAKKIYLIHRKEEFRADEITLERIKKLENVELVLNSVVIEFIGEKKLEKIKIQNLKSGEIKELEVQMVFLEIGHESKIDFVKHLVKTNEFNEIITNKLGETSCEGIFAAGDVTDCAYKQLVIAAGEGAIAALSAYNYLARKAGKEGLKVDWK
ncbi:MAG: thioredoxin-disulfide reductase [Candidatus Aenigmarchaeota archaeon]|nr:thioredoxin-disulfide reductase [Candidatus Aenigmarchaeota archaeon]MDW8159811.1 thioredoxin-disulfide reductase [Candidatus Aenigmarchaeota archaeon]